MTVRVYILNNYPG